MTIYIHTFTDGTKSHSSSLGLTITRNGSAPVVTTPVEVDDAVGNAFLKNPSAYTVDQKKGTITKK